MPGIFRSTSENILLLVYENDDGHRTIVINDAVSHLHYVGELRDPLIPSHYRLNGLFYITEIGIKRALVGVDQGFIRDQRTRP